MDEIAKDDMSEIKGRIDSKKPYWRVPTTKSLIRTIAGVCSIRATTAAVLVDAMRASDSKTLQFATQTILVAAPGTSGTTSRWVIREVTWQGISTYTEYTLEREDRTGG